jgi:hypothetical protein
MSKNVTQAHKYLRQYQDMVARGEDAEWAAEQVVFWQATVAFNEEHDARMQAYALMPDAVPEPAAPPTDPYAAVPDLQRSIQIANPGLTFEEAEKAAKDIIRGEQLALLQKAVETDVAARDAAADAEAAALNKRLTTPLGEQTDSRSVEDIKADIASLGNVWGESRPEEPAVGGPTMWDALEQGAK